MLPYVLLILREIPPGDIHWVQMVFHLQEEEEEVEEVEEEEMETKWELVRIHHMKKRQQ